MPIPWLSTLELLNILGESKTHLYVSRIHTKVSRKQDNAENMSFLVVKWQE